MSEKMRIRTLAFLRDAADKHYWRRKGEILVRRDDLEARFKVWKKNNPQGNAEDETGFPASLDCCAREMEELEEHRAAIYAWLIGQGVPTSMPGH